MDSHPDTQPATPAEPPQSTLDEPAVPKKSKKPLVIGLIAGGALVIAAAVGGSLTVTHLAAQADAEAERYLAAVQDHVDAVYDADGLEHRAQVIDDTAVLTEVMFGENLSEAYRSAQEIEREYEALIAVASPVLKQLSTTVDFRAFFGDISDLLGDSISLSGIEVHDRAALEERKATVSAAAARAEAFSALSVRVQNWIFPEKYQSDQNDTAEGLELMAETWREVAVLMGEYVELREQHLDAEESGETLDAISEDSYTRLLGITEVAAEYRPRTQGMTAAMERLTESVIDDGYLAEIEARVIEIEEQFFDFANTLESVRGS